MSHHEAPHPPGGSELEDAAPSPLAEHTDIIFTPDVSPAPSPHAKRRLEESPERERKARKTPLPPRSAESVFLASVAEPGHEKETPYSVLIPASLDNALHERLRMVILNPPADLPLHCHELFTFSGARVWFYSSLEDQKRACLTLTSLGFVPPAPEPEVNQARDQDRGPPVQLLFIPPKGTSIESCRALLSCLAIKPVEVRGHSIPARLRDCLPGKPASLFVVDLPARAQERDASWAKIEALLLTLPSPLLAAPETSLFMGPAALRKAWRESFTVLRDEPPASHGYMEQAAQSYVVSTDDIAPFLALPPPLTPSSEPFPFYLIKVVGGEHCDRCWALDEHTHGDPCPMGYCSRCPNSTHDTRHCPHLPCMFCDRFPDRHPEGVDKCQFRDRCRNCLQHGHASTRAKPCPNPKGFLSLFIQLDPVYQAGFSEGDVSLFLDGLLASIRSSFSSELEHSLGGVRTWRDKATNQHVALCRFRASFRSSFDSLVSDGFLSFAHSASRQTYRLPVRSTQPPGKARSTPSSQPRSWGGKPAAPSQSAFVFRPAMPLTVETDPFFRANTNHGQWSSHLFPPSSRNPPLASALFPPLHDSQSSIPPAQPRVTSAMSADPAVLHVMSLLESLTTRVDDMALSTAADIVEIRDSGAQQAVAIAELSAHMQQASVRHDDLSSKLGQLVDLWMVKSSSLPPKSPQSSPKPKSKPPPSHPPPGPPAFLYPSPPPTMGSYDSTMAQAPQLVVVPSYPPPHLTSLPVDPFIHHSRLVGREVSS